MSVQRVPVDPAMRDAFIDDFTGVEIRSGGWELQGLGTGEAYHFKSLTHLVLAILKRPETFGLSKGSDFITRAVRKHGIRVP